MESPLDWTYQAAKEMALASDLVQSFIEGKTVVNVIYVPGRLVNIVAR